MSQGFGQEWQSAPPTNQQWQPPSDSETSDQSGRLRPLDLGDILDGMFRLVVRHWRVLLLALAPVLLPVNAIATFASQRVAGTRGLIEIFQNPALAQAETVRVADFAPVIAVSLLSSLFLSPFLYGVCVAVAARGARDEPVETRKVVRAALRRYPVMVVVYAGIFLAPAVVFLPGIGLVAAGTLTPSPPLVIAGSLALLAALPIALAVVVFLVLALPAAVEEPVGPLRALRRSIQLVRGRFWRTLGIVLVAYLITGIVSGLVSLPFGVPGTLFGGAIGATFTGLGGALSGLLSTPLLAAALTLLYLDARVRREGADLEGMMDGLSTT